jgi:hypothetical protein
MWKMERIMLMCAFLLVTVRYCLNVCKHHDSGLRHFMSLLVTFHDLFWHISTQQTAAPVLLFVLLEVILYFFRASCNQTGTVYWKQIIICNVCGSFTDTKSTQTSKLNSGSMEMNHNFLMCFTFCLIYCCHLPGSCCKAVPVQTWCCSTLSGSPVNMSQWHVLSVRCSSAAWDQYWRFPALPTTSETTPLWLALCSASPHTVPPVTTALCFLHAVSKSAQLSTGTLTLCCHFTVTAGLSRHSVPAGSSSTLFLTREL